MTVDPANAARVLAAKVTTWADNELGYRRHRGLLDLDAANSVVAAALEPLAAEPMQSILCFLMERVIAEDKVRHIRQQLVLLLTHKAGPLEALGPSLLVEKHRHYTKLTDRIATLDSTMRTRLAQYSQLVDRIRKADINHYLNTVMSVTAVEMKLAQTRAAANEHARRHRFKRCREQAIRQQINQHRQSTGRWEQQNPAKTPLHTIAECPSHSHTEALYRTLESKREALLRKQDSQGDAHHITALQIAQEILDTVSNREALHHLIAQAQAVASNLHTTAPAPRRPGNLILADAITKLAQLLHQLHQFHVQQHITNVKQASALLRVEQQVQTAQLQLNATLGSLLSNEAQRAAIQQELTHQAMVQAYHTRLELTDQIASQLNNTEAKTNVVDALTQQWSDYAIISRKAKASAILLRLKVKQLQVLLEDYLPRHAQSLAHQSITQQQAIAAKAAHQTQELLIVAGQWPKAVEQELIAFNQAHLLATTWLPSPVAGNRTLVLRSDYLVLERARQDQIYRQVTDVLQLPAELSPQASVYQLIQQSCRYFERAYCTRVSQALMASGQLKMKTLVGNHRPLEGTEQPPGQEGASDDALRDAFAAILHSLQVKADKLAHVRDTNLVPQLEQGLHVALVGTNEHQRAAAFKDGR
ncbi:hypothetical protein H4R35_004555, partial [Dimargaris xerosporica]